MGERDLAKQIVWWADQNLIKPKTVDIWIDGNWAFTVSLDELRHAPPPTDKAQ